MNWRGRDRKKREDKRSAVLAPALIHLWCPGSWGAGAEQVHWTLWGHVFIGKFSLPWREVSSFPCKLIITAHSSRPFWKWVRGFGGLQRSRSPLQSTSASQPHSCACTVLGLSPGARTRAFVQKVLPYLPQDPFSSTSYSFSRSSCLLLPDGSTAVWLSVFETHTLPLYLLGFHTSSDSTSVTTPCMLLATVSQEGWEVG